MLTLNWLKYRYRKQFTKTVFEAGTVKARIIRQVKVQGSTAALYLFTISYTNKSLTVLMPSRRVCILFLSNHSLMKKIIPFLLVMAVTVTLSCSRKYYASSFFDQQTAGHKLIAVLPSEIVLTGKRPEQLTEEQISKIEEEESRAFQLALYSNILQHANSNKYYMFVGVQDVTKTMATLEENHISLRDSWKTDDKKLAQLLGVDAVVRMQIRKKRYMSDYASYGVTVARDVIRQTPLSKLPIPSRLGTTEDIYAYCSVVSNSVTLWNNNYKAAADWDNPSNEIIENITDNFGRYFPYKRRR